MASREVDKAIGGLLRRTLAHDAGPGDVCPTPDLLAAYYQHSLGGEERARQELHFSHCARCREQLAAMARVQEMEKAGTDWVWRWDWRWLVPAAAALALVTIWVTRRAAPIVAPEGSRNAPLVAMSEPGRESAQEKTSTPLSPAAAVASKEKASSPARQKKLAEKQPKQSFITENKQVASEAASLAKESAAPSTAVERRGGVILPDNENDSSTRATLPAEPLAAVKAAPVSPPVARPAPPPSPAAEANDAIGESAVSAQETATGKTEAPPVAPMAMREKRKLTGNSSTSLRTAEERSGTTMVRTPDAAVLWRIAGAGFVERSEDSGATWQGQLVDPQGRLVTGAAPTTKVCWMVGSGGAIFLTKDGKKWSEIAPPETVDFVGVTARDASSATLTAADGRKFSTANGGKSWAPAE